MNWLFLIFVVTPVIELTLLIKVGGLIGVGWTVALVLTTAFIGVNLLRRQGLQTLFTAQKKMQEGQIPLKEVAEGMMLAVAGAFLLTPGFVTDTAGFLLLTPGVRQAVAAYWAKRMLAQGQVTMQSYAPHSRTGTRRQESPFNSGRGDVIDGEYKEVDESQKDALEKKNDRN
ncbi:MAG: FxsA family protein [Oleiphilaceae bacterium]|nr:FxsA family protein [Oleiphilaceae bacterium]